MSNALLDLRVHHKAYSGRSVLRHVHLRLAAGEVLSLVGASGCGKSTLLRIAAGLDRDFEGQVLLDGTPLQGPASRDIGYVFQEPRLFPWLSVERNVGFDADRSPDHARVAALLAEVGLSGYEKALPKQLSGGQAQRVAIARALYTRPRLLLLDEPFSALDAFTRIKLQDLVVELARRHGSSLLMVTHEVEEAVLLSDRVLVLEASPGRIARSVEVPLAHPRARGDAALARWRQDVLEALQAVHAL
ncbi:MAG: ABC transporter ATP-binding protein [Paucibacter sp.]|nr:ABC transporter ATP-binding protein [Roseateles sp.]